MQTEAKPIDLEYQKLLDGARRYKNALMLDLSRTQKPFNPLEIYVSLKTLAIEVAAIREMLFDSVIKIDGEPDSELRQKLTMSFFMKMLETLETHIKALETKIVMPR